MIDLLKNRFSKIAALFGAAFAADAALAEWPELQSTSYFASNATDSDESVVVRGQSDPFYAPPGGAVPGGAVVGQPALPPTAQFPGTTDPFVGGQFAAPPASFDPFSQQVYGINGPQPYRFGWKEQVEIGFLTDESTSPDVGEFSWTEFNYVKEWNGRGATGGIWTFTPQLNVRWFDGPTGPPGIDSDLYRFGLGIKYATPQANGVGWEFGFNPAIATDFGQGLSSDGFQFDGHIASFWRASPQWMWVLGVTYWDREDDIILPYAGAVWTPNDLFEARLLFPKARLEWFLGTPYGVATWFYVTGEYHVESFEIGFENPTAAALQVSTEMQVEDWRIMGGARWETGWLETYFEAGVVFDRSVEFGQVGPNFDPDTAFMARLGFKF